MWSRTFCYLCLAASVLMAGPDQWCPAAQADGANTTVVRYRPPKRGAPSTREASAARGPHDSLPAVLVLAPKHTGVTTRAQPSFAWHQDKPAHATCVLALTNEDTFDTLMELKLTRQWSAGIHRLDLSTLELPLERDVEYRWSVGIITGNELASGDPYSAAHVRSIARSDKLTGQLNKAGQQERIALLAEHGIWYDALAELLALMEASPNDPSLDRLCSELLAAAEIFGKEDKVIKTLAKPSKPPRAQPIPGPKTSTRPTDATPTETNKTKTTGSPALTGRSSSGPVAARLKETPAVRYIPPRRGAPVTRESSAARGGEDSLPNITVLTPKHTAMTSKPYPTLAWRQDKAAHATFVLTLTNQKTLDTLLELRATKHSTAGVHRLDLSRLGLALDADVEYRWSIGVTAGDEHTSGDPYSAGGIRRVTASGELSGRLRKAGKLKRIAILAEGGFWYDALAELSVLIDSSPDNQSLRQLRRQLLTDADVSTGP